MSLSTEPTNLSHVEQTSAPIRPSTPSIAAHPLDIEFVSGAFWDQTIKTFDGVCQEQLHVFAINRWPGVKCKPILFRNGSEIVGGVLMMIQPLPLKVGHIAVSKWGPIFKKAGGEDFAAIYAGAVEAIVAEYDEKRHMMISALPRAASGPVNVEFDYLTARGFQRGDQLKFPNRYMVNLRQSDEEQRKSFAQKWRYHLNKSMKAELTFEHAPADRFYEFDKLYQAMNDRKKFADNSAYDDTIKQLMTIEDDALRPELFFVHQGEDIVAGAIIFKAGDTAVYLYGATNDQALPLRAGYFLHWHVIRWLRDNTRATWYDLGGTDGFQGLHQFKKGMVGDAGVISPVPPVGNYSSKFLPFALGNLAFAARRMMSFIRFRLEGLREGRARPDQQR